MQMAIEVQSTWSRAAVSTRIKAWTIRSDSSEQISDMQSLYLYILKSKITLFRVSPIDNEN